MLYPRLTSTAIIVKTGDRLVSNHYSSHPGFKGYQQSTMTASLHWPLESANPASGSEQRWFHAGSNICLDFHGNPVTAGVTVFSDGNHHMALESALQAFLASHPEVDDIFYATTPPNVLTSYLKAGKLRLGNLTLSRLPNLFISPPDIMDTLQLQGFIQPHVPFMQSRGNVLLIHKTNPKHIQGIKDLLRNDVRLFMSNPEMEKASYSVYRQSLLGLANEANLDEQAMEKRLSNTRSICYGELIHHREAPQCLYERRADVAMVYYHLAKRYTRIFPEIFDFIPLGGSKNNPQPSPGNIISTYHIGLVGDGGTFGHALLKFMLDDVVAQIYSEHGLQRPI